MARVLSNEQLINLLNDLPIGLLKKIARGKLESASLTSKGSIIGAIIASNVNEEQETEYLRVHRELLSELEPETIFFVTISEGVSMKSITSHLESHKFSYDNTNGRVTTNGFDIENMVVEGKICNVDYWYESKSESMTPEFKLEVIYNPVKVGITFDTEVERIELRSTSQQSTSALSYFTNEAGLNFTYPQPLNTSKEELESEFRTFVSTMAAQCSSENANMAAFPLEIRKMTFFYPSGDMFEKAFKGRTDIFDHKDVRYEIDNREGHILEDVRI